MSEPVPTEDYAAPWLIPLAERRARNAKLPIPDMSPLPPAELENLRSRLDAPGSSRIPLEPREHKAFMRMPVIRTPETVTAMAAAVHQELGPGDAYGEGILAAIAWATGQTRTGPITGALPEAQTPTVGEMQAEERAALRVLQGRRERDVRPGDLY